MGDSRLGCFEPLLDPPTQNTFDITPYKVQAPLSFFFVFPIPPSFRHRGMLHNVRLPVPNHSHIRGPPVAEIVLHIWPHMQTRRFPLYEYDHMSTHRKQKCRFFDLRNCLLGLIAIATL